MPKDENIGIRGRNIGLIVRSTVNSISCQIHVAAEQVGVIDEDVAQRGGVIRLTDVVLLDPALLKGNDGILFLT